MAKFLKSTGGGVNDSIGLETVAESGCIGISRADECWMLLEAVAERAPGRVGRDEMWWPGQAPGKTWDGGIVAPLGSVDTLGTGFTVGTVVTLGTATRGFWQKHTALGWGVEGGRGTGGCCWSVWIWMVAR